MKNYWKFEEKIQKHLVGPEYIYAPTLEKAIEVFKESFDSHHIEDELDIESEGFLDLFKVENTTEEEIKGLTICSDDHDWEVEHGKAEDDDEAFTCGGDKVIEVQLAKGKEAFVICHGWDL